MLCPQYCLKAMDKTPLSLSPKIYAFAVISPPQFDL